MQLAVKSKGTRAVARGEKEPTCSWQLKVRAHVQFGEEKGSPRAVGREKAHVQLRDARGSPRAVGREKAHVQLGGAGLYR